MKRFGKSSGDIELYQRKWMQREADTLQFQNEHRKQLLKRPDRSNCILCNSSSLEYCFTILQMEYHCCELCGHVQTRSQPEDEYPKSSKDLFASIYAQQNDRTYNARVSDIYQPKLDWILESCVEQNLVKNQFSVLEIGSGSGFFLKACQNAGLHNLYALEVESDAIQVSKNNVKDVTYLSSISDISKHVARSSDCFLIAAFFVLEHLDDFESLITIFRELPAGTMFAFAVPTVGLATIIDELNVNGASRQLDSVVHTQIFSKRSIQWLLKEIEFEIISEWHFGQDIVDFVRLISGTSVGKFMNQSYGLCLSNLEIDSIQKQFDMLEMSDSVHILAVKS